MKYYLRSMVPIDKEQIMSLLYKTSEFLPEEVLVAEEVIDAYLECPFRDYFIEVATVDATVVGYICYGKTPLTKSSWEVYWLAVLKEHQGFGIGKALLRFSEEDIVNRGGKLMLIETSSKTNYLNTRRFYRHNGFRRIARIVDFYDQEDHLILFEKRF